ncbi:MAG: hypothetical protein OEZ32_11960 [Nitrospinota bacterium]|nr:hypothetical protein [Nitrospinota bacterium]
MEIFEKSLEGLTSIQQPNDSIPSGFDAGVLLAWRDMGMLFDKGCDKITFTLNHRDTPLVSEYTPRGLQSIQARIKGPQLNVRTVEGRLLMADFKEYGARCRVHPSVGDPILCLFDEDKKEEILDSILHYVRVVGEAKEDPNTNKITAIRIQGIQILEGKENEQTDILPQGSPLPSDFWSSPTLEELAEAQGVHPIKDISVLFGTWPGDADDGFEEMITAMREQSVPERDK